MSELLRAAVDRLREARDVEHAEIVRVTVGDRVLLVEVRDGETGAVNAGLAHRPAGAFESDAPGASRAARASPAAADRDVAAALADATGESATRGERALGIATANALSAPLVDWRTGDPMALLDADVERIATVGLFRPAFRKFDGVEVRVVERDPIDEAPDPEGVTVRTYTPGEADAALAGAEVVFVTGSAFIYGGVDRYVAAAPDGATVIVIGATASFLPEPLFEAGVDVVAGAAVADREGVREAVAADACGTDLHDAGVEKVYVVVGRPAGVRLDGRPVGERPGGTEDGRTAADASEEEPTNP